MNVEALFEKIPCISKTTLNEGKAIVGVLKGSVEALEMFKRCCFDEEFMHLEELIEFIRGSRGQRVYKN